MPLDKCWHSTFKQALMPVPFAAFVTEHSKQHKAYKSLFSYLENRNICRKVYWSSNIFLFSTTLVWNIFHFDKYLASFSRVTIEFPAETNLAFLVKCRLLFSDFNRNLNVLVFANVSKTRWGASKFVFVSKYCENIKLRAGCVANMGSDDKCIQHFSRKTWRKEATWQTWA
jgi:hypothetical protein